MSYDAILPDLFRESPGIVTRVNLFPYGTFEAIEVLARHDKSDRPPEFADAWSGTGAELPCEVHTALS